MPTTLENITTYGIRRMPTTMGNITMKKLQIFSTVCLLIALHLNTATADINIIWVRAGAVLETQQKHSVDSKIEVATAVNGITRELAEIPTVQRLDAKRALLQFTWKPNQSYQFRLDRHVTEVTSPLKPMPYLIRTVQLDALLSLLENLRQPAKPVAVALSPDAEKLAIATDTGHLAVLQPLTGETLWKTRISEGYVKYMVFSTDSTRLYIGEQAVDGFIYAYDVSQSKPTRLWKYRTADDIETSTPTNPESVYAWISYPGPSCMRTLANGDLLVASVHAWTQNDISHRQSQLYRFNGKTGELRWKWPRDAALPRILRWFDISTDPKTLSLVTDKSRKGKGVLSVLNAETGITQWQVDFEPLTPYFEGVSFWRGVSMSPNGKFINITVDDGRAYIFDVNRQKSIWHYNLTTPLEMGGVPIVATSGTIGATDTVALFVTGDTYIPYHLQKGAQRPSAVHPNGMTLFAYSWEGEKIWQWKLENMPQGLRIDGNGRYAVLAVSKKSRNPNEHLHGVSVFDLTAAGGGLSKYLYTYRTEGQLPYDTLAISADGGLIVVVEMPIAMTDETIRGKNRVHVLY